MPNKLTLLDLQILLHYFECQTPFPYSSNSAQKSILMFMKNGLMTSTSNENGMNVNCKLTEGGRILVEALCSTPLPVQKWVMSEKDEK